MRPSESARSACDVRDAAPSAAAPEELRDERIVVGGAGGDRAGGGDAPSVVGEDVVEAPLRSRMSDGDVSAAELRGVELLERHELRGVRWRVEVAHQQVRIWAGAD